MEVELQYTPDVQTFYELNQNAEINLNEKALNKNKSLTNIQKNAIKQLVRDVNKYASRQSLDSSELVEVGDKYRQLNNIAGIYGIRDYIKVGNYTGNALQPKPQASGLDVSGTGSDGSGSVPYYSIFPGCPKDNDLRKGYVPSTWIDENGMEIQQSIEGDWKYDEGSDSWKGTINGEIVLKNRNEVPEWEVFIPEQRMIKRVLNAVPVQLPMGKGDWGVRGRKRMNDGGYQARVGTSR